MTTATTKAKPRILSVKIVRKVDESPDTSYLGEYDNEAGPHAIDRKERGDMERNEYQFFNPAEHYEHPVDRIAAYERSERLNRGDWCYLGIMARAEYVTGNPGGLQIRQILTSGGLWGVESDSDASYLAEIENEELNALRDELEAIGCSKKQIAAAFADVQRDE